MTQDNDFAIIKLIIPFTFNARVSPICLPSILNNYDARPATVTGWGKLTADGAQPTILQKVIILSTYYPPEGNNIIKSDQRSADA